MSKFMKITIIDAPKEDRCHIVKVEVSHNMDKTTATEMVDRVLADLRRLTKNKINKLPVRERDTTG